MKKFICIIVTLVFVFCFSACGGNSEEKTTSAPAPELSIEQLAAAVSSGNGAVIDKMEGERYSYFAYVDEVDSQSFIECYMHHLNNSVYDYDYGIKINEINLSLSYYLNGDYDSQQEQMVLSLEQGDKIYFEGTLDDILTYNGMVSLIFKDVCLSEQNEVAQ